MVVMIGMMMMRLKMIMMTSSVCKVWRPLLAESGKGSSLTRKLSNLAPTDMYRVFFFTGTPLKVPSTKNLIYAGLGVSRPIYVNVDSPYLGFPYSD